MKGGGDEIKFRQKSQNFLNLNVLYVNWFYNFLFLAGVIDPMQFSNRAQGFRNDKSQEISSTTAKSYQPVTQGVVGDKTGSINNIRDPEKKEDIVEEFPSWAGKGHPYITLLLNYMGMGA